MRHFNWTILALAAVLIFALACSSSEAPAAPAQPAATAAAAPAAPAAAPLRLSDLADRGND